MKKRMVIVLLASIIMLAGAGGVFAKDATPDGFALGLGYTSNPFHSTWAGGMATFHLPKFAVMFEAYPYLGINGFGLTLSGDWWIINKHIGSVFNWYLGPGLWIDFGLGSYFGLGVGGRLAVGLQAWVLDQLEIFLEAAPGIGLYILPTPDIAWPIPVSLGFRWWF